MTETITIDYPIKLCECGCGQPSPIAKMTDNKRGYEKGQPHRFIMGHGGRGKKKNAELIEKRFWERVDIKGKNECWEWKGGRNRVGYGKTTINKKTVAAHRVAFSFSGGKTTQDKPLVLHKCDNPPCCNPAHLFAGNPNDNMQDKMRKGRYKGVKGDKHGCAKLTEAKVREIYALCETGNVSQSEIAKIHGIAKSTVSMIHAKKIWRHIWVAQ